MLATNWILANLASSSARISLQERKTLFKVTVANEFLWRVLWGIDDFSPCIRIEYFGYTYAKCTQFAYPEFVSPKDNIGNRKGSSRFRIYWDDTVASNLSIRLVWQRFGWWASAQGSQREGYRQAASICCRFVNAPSARSAIASSIYDV